MSTAYSISEFTDSPADFHCSFAERARRFQRDLRMGALPPRARKAQFSGANRQAFRMLLPQLGTNVRTCL